MNSDSSRTPSPTSLSAAGLNFVPISSRRTVQDEVYQRVSEALMSGRLEPGQQLTLASIAEICGTSHMPVREALRRLAAENALEVASTGSAYVPAVSRLRLDDLCEARIINESAAGEKATEFVTPQIIRQMESIIADYYVAAREHDLAGMTAKNQEFHFTIYRASQSSVLVRVIETLWLQFGPYLRLLTRNIEPSLQQFELDTYTKHHYDILEAFKKRDRRDAAHCIAADIKATRALLRRLCDAAERTAEGVKSPTRRLRAQG